MRNRYKPWFLSSPSRRPSIFSPSTMQAWEKQERKRRPFWILDLESQFEYIERFKIDKRPVIRLNEVGYPIVPIVFT